jgi:hypothetical protein
MVNQDTQSHGAAREVELPLQVLMDLVVKELLGQVIARLVKLIALSHSE